MHLKVVATILAVISFQLAMAQENTDCGVHFELVKHLDDEKILQEDIDIYCRTRSNYDMPFTIWKIMYDSWQLQVAPNTVIREFMTEYGLVTPRVSYALDQCVRNNWDGQMAWEAIKCAVILDHLENPYVREVIAHNTGFYKDTAAIVEWRNDSTAYVDGEADLASFIYKNEAFARVRLGQLSRDSLESVLRETLDQAFGQELVYAIKIEVGNVIVEFNNLKYRVPCGDLGIMSEDQDPINLNLEFYSGLHDVLNQLSLDAGVNRGIGFFEAKHMFNILSSEYSEISAMCPELRVYPDDIWMWFRTGDDIGFESVSTWVKWTKSKYARGDHLEMFNSFLGNSCRPPDQVLPDPNSPPLTSQQMTECIDYLIANAEEFQCDTVRLRGIQNNLPMNMAVNRFLARLHLMTRWEWDAEVSPRAGDTFEQVYPRIHRIFQGDFNPVLDNPTSYSTESGTVQLTTDEVKLVRKICRILYEHPKSDKKCYNMINGPIYLSEQQKADLEGILGNKFSFPVKDKKK